VGKVISIKERLLQLKQKEFEERPATGTICPGCQSAIKITGQEGECGCGAIYLVDPTMDQVIETLDHLYGETQNRCEIKVVLSNGTTFIYPGQLYIGEQSNAEIACLMEWEFPA
jgi:hypothetical protein